MYFFVTSEKYAYDGAADTIKWLITPQRSLQRPISKKIRTPKTAF